MKIYVDADKCTGCRTCEAVCYYYKNWKFNPRKSRMSVVRVYRAGVDLPIVCLQCYKPKCAEACPVKAIFRDNDLGVVKVDEKRCTGCGLCAEECIIGAIKMDPETGTPLICDLCNGRPKCVEWCPTNALRTSFGKARQRKWSYVLSVAGKYAEKWKLPSEVIEKYKIWSSK